MKQWTYIALSLLIFAFSCKHEKAVQPDKAAVAHEFPEDIARILVDRCATSGCHNEASYTGAGGLLLHSWTHLFEGGNNGAVVIPYSPENSSLLYFVNTDAAIDITATPTMPYNETPLSKEEYTLLRDWIAQGAPDKNGNIPFAENAPLRQKVYVTQQGCDLVGVIDAEQKVMMRYIEVGKQYASEQPNNIIISQDGRYAYVSFWGAGLIQKIDTDKDSVVATVELPRGYIKAIQLNKDDSKVIACSWYDHKLWMIDAGTMQISADMGNDLQFLSSFSATADGGFYATSGFGNIIYKINVDGSHRKILVDAGPETNVSAPGTPDPYKLVLHTIADKYFVSCANSNEVRIFRASTDELLAAVKVGDNPQEIVFSRSRPYLFVTCMNDTNSSLDVGSVYVVNYETYKVERQIADKFFQPHGIALDEKEGALFVFSRNDDKNGPPPHHSGPCSGRNGFYQIYDISTLQRNNNRRYEVSVDPFTASARFR